MNRKRIDSQLLPNQQPVSGCRLPVRTHLRAGIAWDDTASASLDDQAKAWWQQLTNTLSNATNTLTGGSDTSKSSAPSM